MSAGLMVVTAAAAAAVLGLMRAAHLIETLDLRSSCSELAQRPC
jgi:hypothetical protein